MDNQKFINLCQEIIAKKENEKKDGQPFIEPKEVFVVWSCKTLQNNKAILSLKYKGAPLYELTHNGDKKEVYVDEYAKKSNEKIEI